MRVFGTSLSLGARGCGIPCFWDRAKNSGVGEGLGPGFRMAGSRLEGLGGNSGRVRCLPEDSKGWVGMGF